MDKHLQTRILLKEIQRYHRKRPMIFRSNVYLHEQRVLALVEKVFPFVRTKNKDIDLGILMAMAEIHDDIELKNQELTDPDQEHTKEDKGSIRRFRAMNGAYDFMVKGMPAIDLQILYLLGHSIEAQVVRYADRFDALGECVHEVAAGNELFREPLLTHLSRIYELRRKLPLLAPLLDKGHPFFDIPEFDEEKLERGMPNLESLTRDSGYPPYTFWREALYQKGNETVRQSLFLQIEKAKSFERIN